MARKKNQPCAGGCGTLLWGTGAKNGIRSAAPTCPECRAAAKARSRESALRPCPICGTAFTRRARTCSDVCAQAQRRRSMVKPRACRDCGAAVESHMPKPRCPTCVRKADRAKCARRRAAGHALPKVEGMTIWALGDRDNWRCHLCRKRVDPRIKAPDRRCPSFDHLDPVSDGGTDARSNVKLAHLGCNSRRGAGGTVQLMLVG